MPTGCAAPTWKGVCGTHLERGVRHPPASILNVIVLRVITPLGESVSFFCNSFLVLARACPCCCFRLCYSVRLTLFAVVWFLFVSVRLTLFAFVWVIFGWVRFTLFGFVSVRFESHCLHSLFAFVSFRFCSFHIIYISFVSLRFTSFTIVSFRSVSHCLQSFRFVSFRFVSHCLVSF